MTQEIIKRFNNAKSRKQTNWESTYQDAFQFTMPERDTFYDKTVGGSKDGKGVIYDSVPQDAVSKFVSNIQSSITPPATEWASLEPGDAIAKQDRKESQKKLDEINNIMFSNIKISNFDLSIAESYHDLAVGTGAMLILEGTRKNPFNFVPVSLVELFIEKDGAGKVGATFREFKVAARGVKDTWPDAKLTDTLKNKVSDKPDEEIVFVESTIPAKIKVLDKTINKKISKDGFKYQVIDMDSGEIIVSRDMETNPWIVFRWSVTPGEVYGRGPVLIALPDIKSLNKTKELILKNASLAVSGAYTVVDDGVVNTETLAIEPGVIIPVASNDGGVDGKSIASLENNTRFDVGQIILEDLRTSINSIMFAQPLGRIDSPVRTATEVAFRQQELAKLIGSSYGRLQQELIVPILNRCLSILENLDMIDVQGFRIDGEVLDIKYKSPIQTAKDNEEVNNFIGMVEILAGIYGQEAALILTNPRAVEWLSEKKGLPADLFKGQAEVEQIIQQLSQPQQGAVPSEV